MMNYDEYLRTDTWKATRTRIRRRARGWCERCKVGKRDDVHHLTYEHLGQEHPDELVAVCRECHEFLHGLRATDPASANYDPCQVYLVRCIKDLLNYFSLPEAILAEFHWKGHLVPSREVGEAWIKYLQAKQDAVEIARRVADIEWLVGDGN